MGISSSRPSRRITKQDNAILNMKLQRDRLQQYQKRIQVVLDRERDIAKQYLEKGDKERALLALRKRKYQAQLLTKTDSQLETLEKLVWNLQLYTTLISINTRTDSKYRICAGGERRPVWTATRQSSAKRDQ